MTDLFDKLSEQAQQNAKKSAMPEWMDPMLAKLSHDHFSSPDWIYERKLDGERAISYVSPDGGVRIMSRNQKELNASYPEIEEALKAQAPKGCILDGEVVALDSDGISDFQKLQPRMQASSREESEASGVKIYYYLFDCMYADGHDLSDCNLRSRKSVLKAAIDWEDPLRFTPHRNEKGEAYFEEACQKGWEGIIAKQADSPYLHSRSSKWLKFKCSRQQEFVIGGFTDPEGERIGFGALLLGFYRDDNLVFAGKVGTGFDDDTLADMHDRLKKIERKTSPFDQGEPDTKGVHFVTPKLVCQVAFSEWTQDDKLRHPRYKGLRRDKQAEDVNQEIEQQT